jgi:enamine deaminase RidA (YjgF/YER057c/UK114 family)
MSERINISSGAPWESIAGYCRAVRVGQFIEVAGTTAVDAQGNFFGEGDVVAQTQFVLKKIQHAIEQAGGTMSDVVRTRIFVTDREYMMEVAKVHGEFFGEIMPVSTGVEISALIDDRLLVEIEASAIITQSTLEN